MLLTLGADQYSVSKLHGHRRVTKHRFTKESSTNKETTDDRFDSGSVRFANLSAENFHFLLSKRTKVNFFSSKICIFFDFLSLFMRNS